MINTKTNINPKFIFLAVILIGIYSCSNKEFFTFEKQVFTADTFLDCKSTNCATIVVNLVKTIEKDQTTTRVNKEIENTAIAILNSNDNASKSTLREAITEFNTSYQNDSKKFPDEIIPYEVTIDSKLTFQSHSLISVVLDSYIFTGGAHGNSSITYLNIDPKNGKQISNASLFKNYDAFKSYAEKIFRIKNKISESEPINSTGFFFENDVFSLPTTIGFSDTEVILYYNHYEISSYAEGGIELKLKKEDVASFFNFKIL
ncbi:DUF3298 and DUF4163 domain-containing protein [Aquimarina longa]|uniref:DUF3298 and DUF4163 domain-containing protein n=1 Tax=Aquimarina longa TaxID=1080221 RepID=UPI0007862D37|nr:DUF3298 and DUF4163 domain-containing protein [Aquimarina longa]